MNTKDRIIETAKQLFNQQGATNISTNKIASEMSISKGNLYYYFKNKEEIIREIWDSLTHELDPIWKRDRLASSEEAIAEFFKELFALFYEYRFFYLEISTLLQNDPQLKKLYVARTSRILLEFKKLIIDWTETGMMKKFENEKDIDTLAKSTWVVGELWTTYSNILNETVTAENIKEGIAMSYSVLKPYFTLKSRRKLEKILH